MGGIVSSGAGPFLGGAKAGTVITEVVDFITSDPFKTIRDNAKRKKAQAIADAGGYNTLTEYQKSLINPPAGTIRTIPIQSILIVFALIAAGYFLIRRIMNRSR
jgi:hypothetical protein